MSIKIMALWVNDILSHNINMVSYLLRVTLRALFTVTTYSLD